ncbi:transposase [Halorussus pelagicus]|uniref:transposase n=1 Tax=Halorussus pelagicus TaxID=2505977 RepID=UPI001FB57F21|nr:transposase [Halorussus pelagicus]
MPSQSRQNTTESQLAVDQESDWRTVIEALCQQADDLCHIHNHITRVVSNLNITESWFSDYDEPGRAKYELESVVLMFLYQHIQGFNDSRLARRLSGAAFVHVRLGLDQPPRQQTINYMWRNRFSIHERRGITTAAKHIREICTRQNVTFASEPAFDPDDINAGDSIGKEQIAEAVNRATELGFDEFSANRASNCKYELQAYFERQGYLTLTNAGTTTPRRRFAWLSRRDEVPHGSSHNRTMKKIAAPDSQTDLSDFADGRRPPDWERIRKEVLSPFHAGVDQLLNEIAERDQGGLREPVKAAIDITSWEFEPSPYCNEEDTEEWKEPIPVDGEERYLRNDYPEMVSGLKGDGKRGYQFATLTIVAEDTPLVLAIEPVRDKRWWEDEEIQTTSRAKIVDRLLEQASRHVNIQKLFADRGFDTIGVRDVIDRHDVQYVIPKRMNATVDYDNIEKVKEHSVADIAVEPARLDGGDGRSHDVSIMYVPSTEEKETYSIFTTNAEVSPDRAQGLTAQYGHRWEIENEYKTIKEHFLPTSASKDYRVRFLYFVIAVIMYNVWRLTNFLLRDEVTVNLGEKPLIQAGEISELVGVYLFDPGD